MNLSCPTCGSKVQTVAGESVICSSCGSDVRSSGETTTNWKPAGGKFERFDILAELGSGAFGSVFKAIDPKLGRVIALKVPHELRMRSAETRERFTREAQAVAQLTHPNIVPIYEVGEEKNTPYLVSEFIDGLSLADKLSAGILPVPETARVIAAIADGLEYSHQHGIVHRDVKPSNIMLDGSGTPRITDFGIAKRESVESPLTLEGQVLGTPAYMSPEQARGESKRVDGRSDVYGLGAVLYQMLTGELPFRGNERMIIHQVQKDDPKAPRSLNDRIPRDLETICLKAMEKDPARRYDRAAEMAADLRRFLAKEPILAKPPTMWDRCRKFTQRNRPLVMGTAATVVALILGLCGTAIGMLEARDAAIQATEAANRETEEARRANAALEQVAAKERERIMELARTHVAAGRLASQRGQWSEAIQHFDNAIRLGAPDEVEIRLRLLDCKLSVFDFPGFHRDLESVSQRTDLGKHLAMVRLYQSLDVQVGVSQEKDPRELLREAIKLGLPSAEEGWAKGILAESALDMIRHLQKAVQADPFHVRSHDLLAGALIAVGELEKAREIGARLRILAPNSGSAILYQSLLLAFTGDLKGAQEVCEASRAIAGENGVVVLKLLSEIMYETTRDDVLWGIDQSKTLNIVFKLFSLTPKLAALHNDKEGGKLFSGVNVYKYTCFMALTNHPVFKLDNPGALANLMSNSAPYREAVAEFARVMPSGWSLHLHGNQLLIAGKFAEAAEVFDKALQSKSFVSVEKQSLVGAMVARFRHYLLIPPGPERDKKYEETRAMLRECANRGSYPIAVLTPMCQVATIMNEPRALLAFAEEWLRQVPNDRRAKEQKAAAEYQLGAFERSRATLNEILAKQPQDIPALNHRAVSEFASKQLPQAYATLLDVLKLDPLNPMANSSRNTIEELLKIQIAGSTMLREKVKLWHAFQLIQLGNPDCAIDLALRLTGEEPNPEQVYVLACVYAHLYRASQSNEQIPVPQREQYGQRAIELLKIADQKGFYEDEERLRQIRLDPDIEGLRKLPQFPPRLNVPK